VVIKISDTNTQPQPSIRATLPTMTGTYYYWVYKGTIFINSGRVTRFNDTTLQFSKGNFKLTLDDDGNFTLSGTIRNSKPGGRDISGGITFTSTDKVYVAGYYGSPIPQACYWLNGTKTDLTQNGGRATCIAVSGTDVYVAGAYQDGSVKFGYWKNGNVTQLAGDGIRVNAIAVSGSDVYVVGAYNTTSPVDTTGTPCYWINGTKHDLTDYTGMGIANAIAISNGDIYIAGYYKDGGNEKACYWLNGTKTDLNNSRRANAIAVSGADVYVAGYYGTDGNEKACYWLNGTKTDLLMTGTKSYANAIVVSDSNVYIAGYYTEGGNDKACYWKNEGGNITRIGLHTGTKSGAEAIAVSGGAVYVAGWYTEDGTDKACYWKNGNKTNLHTTSSQGLAIAVTQ
jgi:hypothetical protein